MTEWKWIGLDLVRAVHDYQLAEHGGLEGVRDQELIESALARPPNLASYGDPDAAVLAAAYAFGIARNHGFADGNKRTAWVLARLFLADNGFALIFEKPDAVRMMEALAAGSMPEPDVAQWFRVRIP